MTKKSKGKSKVGTVPDLSPPTSNKTLPLNSPSSDSYSSGVSSSSSQIGNGDTNSSSKLATGLSSLSNTSKSLASIPGIVDDFLAPTFVKVLSLSEHPYEKSGSSSVGKNSPSGTDTNGNKVSSKKQPSPDKNEVEAAPPPDAAPPPLPSSKKNKRKKSKPVKHTTSVNVSYDSEDGRELDDLSFNGDPDCSSNFTGLTSRNVSTLAQHQRIRSSAFRYNYEGNNIVVVSNDDDSAQYPSKSCYDDYKFEYDDDEDLVECRGGASSSSGGAQSRLRCEETIGLLDNDDDDDENGREGSWSVPGTNHHSDYSYPLVQPQQASSSVASSIESDNNPSSLSTNASYGQKSLTYYPALDACTSIFDGGNPCAIKDCMSFATKKCSQCKAVYYCSDDHQRTDWRNKHKNECIPFRMESRFGDDISVAVASRNIPAGQKVFSEKPLLVLPVADPDNDFVNVMDLHCIKEGLLLRSKASGKPLEKIICSARRPACFGCLKATDIVPGKHKCQRCHLPLCSYNCYLDSTHSMECQAISGQGLGQWREDQHFCYHTMYLDVEILRALQMEAYDSSMWQRFMEMKQNLRVESYKSSARYKRFIENYKELVPTSAKLSGYNEELIGNVHSIISALSFRPSLKSSYKLLFSTIILFGHDCIPNTFHYLEESQTGKVSGMTLVVKAASPIVKKEIITIDFSPTAFLYYPLRRMILRNILSIDNCQCKRCVNPTDISDHSGDIKCQRCHKGVICPERAFKWSNSVWGCNACFEEFSYHTVEQITKECRSELAMLLNQPRNVIVPALQQFINRREHDLHEGHSIILQAWSFIEAHLRPTLAATKLAGPAPRYDEKTVEDYRLLNRCGTALENHLRVVRPGICYERGCVLVNRYHMELAVSAKRSAIRMINRKEYIQELLQAVKTLQEALQIFQMYEGYNRDVALHIQETTSSLVTVKKYIQELLITESAENKQKQVMAVANASLAMVGSYNLKT